MRVTGIAITGLGVELGRREPSSAALEAGSLPPADAAATRQKSVCCSDMSAPELAVRAAQKALAVDSSASASFAMHLYATSLGTGIEGWNASCYILRHVAQAGPMLSGQVNFFSNGCLGAIELAACVAMANTDRRILVTAADRWVEPFAPRWSSLSGAVLGDGAAAAVLAASDTGIASLIAIESYTEPVLEGLYRGSESIVGGGAPASVPISLKDRSDWFIASQQRPAGLFRRPRIAARHVVRAALDTAELEMSQIGAFVMPFFGEQSLRTKYLDPLGIPADRTLLEFGLTTGHLGAADQLVGLYQLIATGRVGDGDFVMLVGVGAGFTWSAAVVRVLDSSSMRRGLP